MSTPDQILFDKFKQLPAQRMAEVEDFVAFLHACTRVRMNSASRTLAAVQV